jgi:hypothetical protein
MMRYFQEDGMTEKKQLEYDPGEPLIYPPFTRLLSHAEIDVLFNGGVGLDYPFEVPTKEDDPDNKDEE